MDQADIQARVIGLLTAVYNTLGKDPYALNDLVELMAPVLDGFGPDSIKVQVTGDQSLGEMAESVVLQVGEQIRPTVQTIIVTFITAFVSLCHEYERDYPKADVSEFLQSFALIMQGNE